MNSTFLNPPKTATIAIIGGGFSGALVATHLLKTATQPLTIKLIERSHSFGKGIAYSTDATCHLLNVSAGNMSAFPNDPGHLLRWLQHNKNTLKPLLGAEVNPSTFIPRKVYGLYIQSILAEAEATANSDIRLERLTDEVVAIAPSGTDAILSLASGDSFYANKVVLALGNTPFTCHANENIASYQRHAWSADALTDLAQDAPVLIMGTGLTMVDMVLSLHEQKHQGKIYAVSRRGLFPQRHQATQFYPSFLTPETAPTTALSLLHRVRAEVKSAVSLGYDWRGVIDSLRPITPQLWQQLSTVEQQRFLLHIAPYWDVHRHRIAQKVADILGELLDSGQLTITAGRIQDYQQLPDGVAVTVRQRNTQTNTIFNVSRVVNCTGITVDYRKFDHPLITSLRSQGLIRPNPLGLGLDTAVNGALWSADGQISTLFYTLGTPRKGDLWETIAVPEIREQVQALAETLLRSLPLSVRSIPTIHLYPLSREDRQVVEELSPGIFPSNLLFRQFFDPETSSYTYLIADQQTGDAVLVDPVLEQVDRDLRVLDELELKLKYCLETHLHADHITGAGKLRKQTGAQVIVPQNPTVTKADHSWVGGETINIGSVMIEAIATPGHTASHIAYLVNKTHLLTGDALLIRGCGRTDFQGGDPGTLYDGVTQRLFTLPDETLVYPAHDYKGWTVSTIGEEKRQNPRFADRSREQFITIMNNLNLSYPKKMKAAVPANEYCGDFISDDPSSLATSSATEEEQKQIELTVSTNTEIYNDYFAMYI
ncbi:Persulfide dioxygenase ETHE1 homolog, mitochondrial [Planktothrix tepida]|uniref:Beta-lactamase domain protein n=2 Tax=Planktothrix TaxID=54304 RepID=A0A1J1LI73_9CYAN|nr:Persulfide dioxygenase ETHE1 homolog, mitochondrial [Planktothrix pseudagardhii]CAD5983277.1 Persulfide dioxygenase ETHE1 homolog, mitochondrial [Planktothrix tepida]CUR32309.1 Beta-lactamase domain protein [Planktothrix tepida PCC 9214]